MEKRKGASILVLSMILVLSLSLVSASWFSDIFNKNKVAVLTGNAACGVSGCPKTSSSTVPVTTGLPSALPIPTCTGTSSFSKCPVTGSSGGAAASAVNALLNFLCTSSSYKDYCKVVSGKCVKKSCSEVPLSSCNGSFGCSTTSVKVAVPIYGSKSTVDVWVPTTQAKLTSSWVWCWADVKPGQRGFVCIDKCGVVNYATGSMNNCESAILLK